MVVPGEGKLTLTYTPKGRLRAGSSAASAAASIADRVEVVHRHPMRRRGKVVDVELTGSEPSFGCR